MKKRLFSDGRELRLYNVIFPVWMLFLFPLTWLVILPANLIIDTLVIAITLKCLRVSDLRRTLLRTFWIAWLFGFVADFIGTAFMFLGAVIDPRGAFGEWWYSNIANPISMNPFRSVYAVLWTLVAVALSGAAIYLLNRFVTFRKSALGIRERKIVSLSLAVFTAPYLFFLPTQWLTY